MIKILLADDEKGIASFVKQGLEEEGFFVQVCHSGTEAYQEIQKSTFDLYLLDWVMPGQTGLELCELIRTTNKDVPIIFLTAKDTVQDTILALKSGANDYLKKPFHFEELLERIKVLLRPRIAAKEAILKLGDISLNLQNFQVLEGEKEVHLTQKEFALLAYLLKNKGKVCTRQNIIKEVWDIHFDYDTGVIDVYMNAIRKKLKSIDTHSYIQTIRGVGYLVHEE